MIVNVSRGISQWSKDRRRQDRPHSGDRETRERSQSVVSIAASEGSHGGQKKPNEPEREATNYTISTIRNYYKNVSENKEVAKLLSLLSTSINSTKKVN